MPNPTIRPALAEAYASAPTNKVVLETLQIHCDNPSIVDDLWLVRNREDITATLEEDYSDAVVEQLFKACAFDISLPESGESGLQEIRLRIDNVNQELSDFLRYAAYGEVPILVTYRPYLSTDLSQPQMDPPLRLFLKDVNINMFEVTAKATFSDIVNMPFPNDYYTNDRFPSIADG
jgi:hypothetical protein